VPTGRLYVNSNHLATFATVVRTDERERDPKFPPSEGEKVYQTYCIACHGPRRQGVAMVPSIVGLKHRMSDDEVVALLRTGRGAMPPFPMLEPPQRDALLDYLMRRNQPPPAPARNGEPRYTQIAFKFLNDHEGHPGVKPPWGTLNCLDLNTGRILWRVPLGEYVELTKRGVPTTGTENFGGPTVTAGGLVFCAGTKDEKIRAFDKDTGAELWSAKLPFGGYAPPATYEVDGRQYVVIAATGGGKPDTPVGDAWVAFALPPE
jgi:quinoprotein glucose dehydrogenase